MAKTIAGKIIAAFMSLFPSFIEKTYKKIEPELREEISWITQIVSKINDVLQSPGVDVITYVIPGNADDKFVEWARIIIDRTLTHLKNTGVENLSNADKAKLSAELTHEKTGMKLSQSFITSQVVYEQENK